MNIIKITNKIALATVVLLMYWVFIFVTSVVFGFKVFRENMTEMFMLSIFGIFAVLSGAIILNIMFNLTAIAEGRGKQESSPRFSSKQVLFTFIGSLVVIFLLLYSGDMATAKKRERHLVSSATELINEQKEVVERLGNYSFTREYIEEAGKDIKLLSKIEEKFPKVTVIARDYKDGKPLLLGFGQYTGLGKKEQPLKVNYILSTSSKERKYLYSVFEGKMNKHLFSSNDNRYEIYYPVKMEKGVIVIHLSQYSRYGKYGS